MLQRAVIPPTRDLPLGGCIVRLPANMESRCFDENFQSLRTPDDNLFTLTFEEQSQVEESVDRCYQYFKLKTEGNGSLPDLERQRHGLFLLKGLQHLSQSYECLDASRPWLCYWILHSLELLEIPIPPEINSEVCQFLAKCQNEDGGFGGGPGQVAHLAPTYAAINALCILGTEEAFNVVNRESMRKFLLKMHQPNGAFIMHESGEEDIRGAYCAASVARLTHIMTKAMFDSTPQWIVSCQTYEGGFGGVPGMEAHGGYSFCGLAALVLLNHERLCDIQALLRWTTQRQMSFEGGFQGRTNKLVDGCYSFWQGGAFPLIHGVLAMIGDKGISAERWLFNQEALQEYLLICCQHPAGGLIDKPGKPRDYYHTCYCLSGLSVAQHFAGGHMGHKIILGSQKNELKPTHPIYNIGVEAVMLASQYYSDLLVSELPDKES